MERPSITSSQGMRKCERLLACTDLILMQVFLFIVLSRSSIMPGSSDSFI